MSNINENTTITAAHTPSSKPSSLSRANKIPQKFAQSSFFSLKPSTSSLINNNGGDNSNNRLTARLGQMLFRQRITSESIITESRSFSTQNADCPSSSLGRNNHQSRSLDIRKSKDGFAGKDHLSIVSSLNNDDNSLKSLHTRHIPSSPYYSISSPEKTDFYSYYYSSNGSNTAGSVLPTTPKEENQVNPLFSPLSFTNSSVSSLSDSIACNNSTPPTSPMPQAVSNDQSDVFSSTIKPIDELISAIDERCFWFLDSLTINFSHIRDIETIIDQTSLVAEILKDADTNNDSSEEEDESSFTTLKNCREAMDNMYRSPISIEDNLVSIKSVIKDIQNVCQAYRLLLSNLPTLSNCTTDAFKKESTTAMPIVPLAEEYQSMKSDQIDENSNWFRHHFVGKPYQTFIGSLQPVVPKLPLLDVEKKKKTQAIPKRRNSKSLLNSILSTNVQQQPEHDSKDFSANFGIISVIQEKAKDFGGPRNAAAAILGSQYRIIIRSKEAEQARFIIHECMAKETQTQLESRGESHKMDAVISNNDYRRPRPFSANNNGGNSQNRFVGSSISTMTSMPQNTFSSRMTRAAILSACPNIDIRTFKELNAESTILAGLEKDLLKYDEIHVPKHYKFGLLNIKNNQSTEESWFSNTGLSKDLKDFLNIMGKKIELKGFKGYAAGLDTKTGESGEFAYISKWRDYDIMFHVAAIMPTRANDRQQILRKKHIGNDIVCVIFLEGDQLFNPQAIRSQFLHVYVLVRPEYDSNNNRRWRIEVLTNKNVGSFGPALPTPPIFDSDSTLKEFLTLKLINAENAALKSDKFYIPNNKARLGLLTSHIETGMSFSTPQVLRSASTNRLHNKSDAKKVGKDEDNTTGLIKRRPKSVNNNKTTHHQHQNNPNGSRLLRQAILDEEKRRVVVMASTDIPPMPSISKSTLLQDFKKGFSRIKTAGSNRTSSQEQKKVLRKSSHLKISSIPENSVIDSGVIKIDMLDEEDGMFVGRGINISSESFISTEQLFSITTSDQP